MPKGKDTPFTELVQRGSWLSVISHALISGRIKGDRLDSYRFCGQ